jgi:BirA family biotin operon repressor/biotin-[acetyl-CoA-carboxylase] ligase
LSLSWSYATLPPDVGALSLAVGVGIWRVMRRFGLHAPRLKWPNDVLLGARKLCGVLLELRAEMAGPALVVVGMGVNCALAAAARGEVSSSGTEPADLLDAGARRIDRNEWAAALIAETVLTLQAFADGGFHSFTADWQVADALVGTVVVVRGTHSETQGTVEGIDGDGALRLRTATGLQRFTSGDVSVRIQP